MAKFPVITEGLDPTGIPDCLEKDQLLQMVHEAEFVDYVGAIIYSSSAPDVVTYPKLAWFTWHKTISGVPSGQEFYWTGTEWYPKGVPAGTLTGAAFQDGSIGLGKLSAAGGTLGDLIRVAAGDVFEFVSSEGLIVAGSVALTKLASASGAGYFIYTDDIGAPYYASFSTVFGTFLSAASVGIAQLADNAVAFADGQVLHTPFAGGEVTGAYVEDLVRDNTLLTKKLKLSALAGKRVKVNAAGTDFEVDASPNTRIAILRQTKSNNTNAQVINAAGPTVVELDAEEDVDGIVTLAANVFRLGAGTFKISIHVPLYMTSGDLALQVELYNNTAASVEKYRNAAIISGGDYYEASLVARVAPAVATDYSIRILAASAPSNLYLGRPANLGRNEIYAEITIEQLS